MAPIVIHYDILMVGQFASAAICVKACAIISAAATTCRNNTRINQMQTYGRASVKVYAFSDRFSVS